MRKRYTGADYATRESAERREEGQAGNRDQQGHEQLMPAKRHCRLQLRGNTRSALPTVRGPVSSDGWFTMNPRTTIVVDPPPSRFSAERRPSRRASAFNSANVMPRLSAG